MNKKFKVAIITLVLLGIVAGTVLFFCTQNIAVLNPKGMIAIKQRHLLITATWLMLIVVIPVIILTMAFAWKYRASNKSAKYTPNWEHNYIAECLWWGIPCVIIVVLGVITWKSSHDLDPFKPIDTGKKPLTVQVIALQWKWLFIYPEQGIATVNFVQFPEQTPINFEITADAPMNSFWIPQLGGQIYAMPAMRTKLHLIASEVGTFRGSSANISGTGFAGMVFSAKATTEEEFTQWVQSVGQSPNRMTLDTYNELVKPSEYNPVASYVLVDGDLFEQVLRKYYAPAQ